MIRAEEILPVAMVNKTHGIKGEMSVTFDIQSWDIDIMDSFAPGACLIADIDGILTPFFVRSLRPRHGDTFLLAFDGVDDEKAAAAFTGLNLFMPGGGSEAGRRNNSYDEELDPDYEASSGGFFASDIIGLSVEDTDGTIVGLIRDVDFSTINTLLVVERPDGERVMLPLAEDLICDIDLDARRIVMNLPEGLLNL